VDLKVSRKETRLQPEGPAEILVSDVFDLYPVFHRLDKNLIVDVEILDDEREELLDRAMFAAVKQLGQDPVDPDDGVPYAEALVGEIAVPALIPYIVKAVQKEGPGARVSFGTAAREGREYLEIKLALTETV
jgi:hypothetical protein